MTAALGRCLQHHKADLNLALRGTVAALITFSICQLLALPQIAWAVLTAVIVTQASVGASLKATLDRLVGTLAGALWGFAVAVAVPAGGVLSRGIALAVAVAPLALLAAFRPDYRIAPVTAIIVIGAVSQHTSPVASAVDRMLDVGVGSIVGLAVALLVLPARAHGLLAESAASLLTLMADDVVLLLGPRDAAPDPGTTKRSVDQIRAAVARVEAAVEASAHERTHHLTAAPDPEPLVRTLRRLHHDLVMVRRATVEPLPEPPWRRLAMPAGRAATEIAAFLRTAGGALTARAPVSSLDRLGRALDDYAVAMTELRRDGLTRDLSDDGAGRIFGLAFALDQMRRNIEDLADRVREWTPARPIRRTAQDQRELRG